MRVLILDNYDSFTYNLFQMVSNLLARHKAGIAPDILANDKISYQEIVNTYDRVILSPGPGNPADRDCFGVCADVLKTPENGLPVLGVCLGMQGIAHYFGGKIVVSDFPVHGKTTSIWHTEKGVFKNIPQPLKVMRYHSLMVDKRTLPDTLEITALSNNTQGEIMGLRHKHFPIEGIQFHPESFATEFGEEMIENFLFGGPSRT